MIEHWEEYPANFIRVYLRYESLPLKEFRLLLSDLEAVYKRIDKRRVVEGRHHGSPENPRDLRIEEIETGSSITVLLSGDDLTVRLLAELLRLVHQHWNDPLSMGVALGGAAAFGNKFRGDFLAGNKVKAETRKIDAETAKLQAETWRADVALRAPVPSKSVLLQDKGWLVNQMPDIPEDYSEDDVTASRIIKRLRLVSRSSNIKELEIDIDGERFRLTAERMDVIESEARKKRLRSNES